MNKALMISIQPQHAINILNGKKTHELRTWIPKDYVGWVYVYITKCKRLSVVHDDENGKTYYYLNSNWGRSLNQDIPFRFWFDEYIELEHYDFWGESYYWKNTVISAFELEKATCMSSLEMEEYAKCKTLYAWHIKDLEIFDEPKNLSEFYTQKHFELNNFTTKNVEGFDNWLRLKKAPQKMVWIYVEDKE